MNKKNDEDRIEPEAQAEETLCRANNVCDASMKPTNKKQKKIQQGSDHIHYGSCVVCR